MRKVWAVVAGLSLALASCAPGVMGSESWGKATFSPSESSDRAACEAGYSYGKSTKSIQTVGFIQFSSPRGPVRLLTRLGMAYFLCNSIGMLNGRKPDSISPVFQTNISFDDAAFVGKVAKVSIALEDANGQEFARLNAPQDSTEKTKQWYEPKSYSNADLAALDKAVSFTILIDRGAGEEKYKVTQRFQPYGPAAGMKSNYAESLNQQHLKTISARLR